MPMLPIQGGYPDLKKLLERADKGRALYFNTSSCLADENGKLRHKKELFSALHLVVLDDIGTKVKHDDLPALFQEPSYIIETSKGNYQYGFILDAEVTNIDHATALVQTLAHKGLTDTGGCIAVKVVRLPGGFNGKKDPSLDKGLFEVKLCELNDRRFKPVDIIEAADLEINGELVTWRKIQAGLSPTAKKFHSNFMPIVPQYMTVEGVVDPLLEWMHKAGWVISDTGDAWIDILCPRGDQHSDVTAEGARYAPVGRGDKPLDRGFKCFHDSCSGYNTLDFISYVLANSNFERLAITDLSANLVTQNVFDEQQNVVWRVAPGKSSVALKLEGFKNKNNQKSRMFSLSRGNLNTRSVTAAQQWMESPARLAVEGTTHKAGGERFVKKGNGLYLNTYQPPPWGAGRFEQNHVDMFLDFLKYLIPDKAEREYFIQWLAAKVQNPAFRGTGIVMVAPTYGVGRTTLSKMVSALFGDYNVVNIGFEELIRPDGFNHWEDKSLCVVSEAKETGASIDSQGGRRAYESLKQRVDTTAQMTSLNRKNLAQVEIETTTSYLILTNHEDALSIPANDRRFTILQNPAVAAAQTYFTTLNDWLKENWAESVYRWFKTAAVNIQALQAPLLTAGKKIMVVAGQQPPERVATLIAQFAQVQGLQFIVSNQFEKYVVKCLYNHDSTTFIRYSNERISKAVTGECQRFSKYKARWGEQTRRVVVFTYALTKDATIAPKLSKEALKLRVAFKSNVEEQIGKWDEEAVLNYVAENM